MRVANATSAMWRIPWLVFGLVFAWKIGLLIWTVQPVPGNDAFFYDGPVVYYLTGVGYVNASIARTLPISGTELFSAYPPFYQAVLLVWMSCFGTSAISAMGLHIVLFGLYLIVVVAILRELGASVSSMHIAGAFLCAITFHDRPDSLAHVLGVLALWGLIRSWTALERAPVFNQAGWQWFMAVCGVCCVCTSLQIGAVYYFAICACVCTASLIWRAQFHLKPIVTMLLTPCILVCVVMLFLPRAWAGFVEHAQITPSLMGLHMPGVTDILKIIRTVPGLIVTVLLFIWLSYSRTVPKLHELNRIWLVTVGLGLTSIVIVLVCTFFWSANMVLIAAYLQPLIVGGMLSITETVLPRNLVAKKVLPFFVGGVILGAIRAVGMSTWGVACAADVNYAKAMDIVRTELAEVSKPGPVVLSSAYLYEAAKHRELNCIHSDWLGKFVRGKHDQELGWLLELKPPKLILTQFDYYRRYARALTMLKGADANVLITVRNTAKVPAPDSYPLWQRVVQHVSWAPVIVELTWR